MTRTLRREHLGFHVDSGETSSSLSAADTRQLCLRNCLLGTGSGGDNSFCIQTAEQLCWLFFEVRGANSRFLC